MYNNIPAKFIADAINKLPDSENQQFGIGINFYYKDKITEFKEVEFCLCFIVNSNSKEWELDLVSTANKNQ